MSEYIAKASIEPRDYRVVFLIQKKNLAIRRVLFLAGSPSPIDIRFVL